MQVQPQEPIGSRRAFPDRHDGANRDRAGNSMLIKWCAQGLPDAEERSTGLTGAAGSASPIDGSETFVLSADEVDRHGDVVAADGWVLDSYRNNPVLLWAHDYRHPAIGRAVELWTEPHRLLAKMEFAPSEFAQEVAGLYRSGFQWGVSVGFKPLKFEDRRDEKTGAYLGVRFIEQELLEVSAVPVPANRNALRRTGGPIDLSVDLAALEAVWPVLAGQVDELAKLTEEMMLTMAELESAAKTTGARPRPDLVADMLGVLRECPALNTGNTGNTGNTEKSRAKQEDERGPPSTPSPPILSRVSTASDLTLSLGERDFTGITHEPSGGLNDHRFN